MSSYDQRSSNVQHGRLSTTTVSRSPTWATMFSSPQAPQTDHSGMKPSAFFTHKLPIGTSISPRRLTLCFQSITRCPPALHFVQSRLSMRYVFVMDVKPPVGSLWSSTSDTSFAAVWRESSTTVFDSATCDVIGTSAKFVVVETSDRDVRVVFCSDSTIGRVSLTWFCSGYCGFKRLA